MADARGFMRRAEERLTSLETLLSQRDEEVRS